MDALTSNSFPIKACSRTPITVGPYETSIVNGFIRNLDGSVTDVVTENIESSPLTVCPRVLKVDKFDYCKISVKVCNISAKPMVIKPRSPICQISEVKVIDNLTEDVPPPSSPSKSPPSVLDELGIKIDKSTLTDAQYLRAQQVLGKWEHIFSKSFDDLGRTNLVKHKIDLTDDTPFKQPYRRIPPGMYEEVRQHLKDMLAAGAIRESNSPYSSNVVLVRKRDNSLRFCIDYRTLNAKTRKDAYMLPRFDDTVDTLAGSRFFSKLDLRSGYWQVEMEEEDKEKTAFSVGNLGFYECERMSFGLCNAPATFQRLMEKCMGELHLRECLIFIDDILIFSRTFEEHLERLQSVFSRLEQHNLKLKPSKCEFFKSSVGYLGHIVSQEGVATDPEKTAAIEKWQPPTNVKELRQFLGFASYYRRFVKDFSSLAQPLNSLLEGHGTHTKSSKSRKSKKGSKQPTKWVWGEAQQKAFLSLKEKLVNPPVLAYADYSLPFSLHTDASGAGLGAVLYQKQDGVDRVIAYASRGLRNSEKKYPAHKLEFLALKWAVTDKFHDYLMGNSFEVVTDNNPLTYVLTTAKLDATGQRWVSSLANYDFSIKYRSGKQNTDADALSRLPELFSDSVKAICQSVVAGIPYVESLPGADTPHSADKDVLGSRNLSNIDWQREQQEDPILSRVVTLRSSNFRPREKAVRKELPAVQKYLREWNKLQFRDNVFYRIAVLDDQPVQQLLVPNSFRYKVLKGVHDEAGHQGKDKTLWLAKRRFFWPGLERDVESKVKACPRCVRRKTPVKPVAQLNPILTTRPMELVCIDFLSLEPSRGGFENILVITDHFTRYAQAVPCRNQTAQTTAKALYEHFFRFYSFPSRLHSDQGRNFESKVIKELCKLTQTEKTRTTPYHPMGNGSAERFNQTLLKMLGTLENHQKSDWKTYVAPLVQAYNATKNDATGFSPHFLMFGWHPRLSVDAFLGTAPSQEEVSAGPQSYGRKLKARMEYAYDVASKHAGKVSAKNKAAYDRNLRESALEVGDRVLVRNVGLKGKQKLADRWEEQQYVVTSIPDPSIPVYVVKLENGSKTRTLHRNMLLPFNTLPETPTSAPVKSRRKPTPKSPGPPQPESSSESGSADESEVPRYVIPMKRSKPQRSGVGQTRSSVLTQSEELGSTLSETTVSSRTCFPSAGSLPNSSSVTESTVTDPSVHTDPVSSPSISLDRTASSVADQSSSDPTHTPPTPADTRPTRNRRPPDRYGQWVYSQKVGDPGCDADEIFV